MVVEPLLIMSSYCLLRVEFHCLSSWMQYGKSTLHINQAIHQQAEPVPVSTTVSRYTVWDGRISRFSDGCLYSQGWILETKTYRVSAVKFHFIYAFYFFLITSPKWSSWRAVPSRNCDRKLAQLRSWRLSVALISTLTRSFVL